MLTHTYESSTDTDLGIVDGPVSNLKKNVLKSGLCYLFHGRPTPALLLIMFKDGMLVRNISLRLEKTTTSQR